MRFPTVSQALGTTSSSFASLGGLGRLSPVLCLLALCGGKSFSQQSPSSADTTAVQAEYGKLPLSFEANQGQNDPQVKFSSRGSGYSLFLTDSAAVLALSKEATHAGAKNLKVDVIRMELAGESRGVRVTGADELPGKVNYVLGNDPTKWDSNVPTYAKVKYSGVYPGVDLVYYGNQRQLEYDFVVAPRADTKPLRLHFAGASRLELDKNGDLTVLAKNGEIAFHKPVVYQVKNGHRQPVDGKFRLLAKTDVGFTLGAYDHNRELVIDPTLGYSTYLGGTVIDNGTAIAVDKAGDAYVTGTTFSPNFPVTTGSFQTIDLNSIQFPVSVAYVTKLNPRGSAELYSTFLGGTGGDQGNGIAIDIYGDAYVTGLTCSADFPITPGAYQTVNKGVPFGNCVAFVTKLNAEGSAPLIYSTFLGGTGDDAGVAIAIDPAVTLNADGAAAAPDAFVMGATFSTDFPITALAFQKVNKATAKKNASLFVTRLNGDGSHLTYSTYLGGSGAQSTGGIAVDKFGDAFVSGGTGSTDFPTVGAYQPQLAGTFNAFATELDREGHELLYSTYLGGTGFEGAGGDSAYGIAIDATDKIYLGGYAGSIDFPVTSSAFQNTNNSIAITENGNGFVSKLDPTVAGSAGLLYSTYLGGDSGEQVSAIAVDSDLNVHVTGHTFSQDFPVTHNAFQPIDPSIDFAVFYTKIDPNLVGDASLLYSTYLDGNEGVGAGVGGGYGIAVDSFNNVYLTGTTNAENFPITSLAPTGAFQKKNKSLAGDTAFVSQFAPAVATSTTVVSDANPSHFPLAVTFTAKVVPVTAGIVPTGTVRFAVDGIASKPIIIKLNSAGYATYPVNAFELGVGDHQVTAYYSGDEHYEKSSGTMIQVVLKRLLPR